MKLQSILILLLLLGLFAAPFLLGTKSAPDKEASDINPRSEIRFWHFWGGQDREVVDDVVARFNASQEKYYVRAIAMPGNNLQAKLFLSVAGGDPPDLVNQDDPVLADWAERGIIMPIDQIAGNQSAEVGMWMFDSAQRLSTYNNRLYGVCNGLDVRALYYNRTILNQFDLSPPKSIDDLTHIANVISPSGLDDTPPPYYAYLPDSRRLWAWGYVFGGQFVDKNGRVSITNNHIVDALKWMQSFGRKYGPDNLVSFRQGDQSLPGKTFPLLPIETESMVGRYAMVMDGQWRTRDINKFLSSRQSRNIPAPDFGVCPLPYPENGKANAGWVNGNFFVVPRGAKNPEGAWEFMKFWIGFQNPKQAAETCVAGGWIPVSQSVVDSPNFQKHLLEDDLFAQFVELASSPNQYPVPQLPGAQMFRRTIESAAYQAMIHPEKPAEEILNSARAEIQAHLDRIQDEFESTKTARGEN